MSKTTKKPAAAKATKTAKAQKASPAKMADPAEPVKPAGTVEASTGDARTKTRAAKKAKPDGDANTKKVSAIDAAAQVLAESKEPMNCKALIEAMAAQGLWTSPGGKTPSATLYSAILREISVKGKDARFKKTDRGHFTANR